MVATLSARRSALPLVVVLVGVALGSATAAAAGLDDHRWKHRPLLVFAPTDTDPRLAETLSRIEATRCDFLSRDMVLGQVVTEGTSMLDGHVVDAEESQQLADRFAIHGGDFIVLLIGKDGGEKLRVTDVPDLRTIYAVIDGMPMRSREMTADPSEC
ncbi:DUF4174 domain-containing protein [Mycolicibacterium vaccae]|uniref:DUF4174 domain-containing protein n=1 Tax=Mycolicibacterium vaccae TaxID=1810 RepID=UPI003D08F1CF